MPSPHTCRRGDYYRYLAELTRLNSQEDLGKASLEAYKSAYQHALATLSATHPTRLGLALNFAVYFHDIMRSPERACHLAKHAFDEAVAAAVSDASIAVANIEDALMILQLMRDDLILWQGEISKGERDCGSTRFTRERCSSLPLLPQSKPVEVYAETYAKARALIGALMFFELAVFGCLHHIHKPFRQSHRSTKAYGVES